MAEVTVAGIKLNAPDDLATPLGAVAVIKALDSQGEIAYYFLKSDDVSRIEAVGMLVTASDEFRASLAELARDTAE